MCIWENKHSSSSLEGRWRSCLPLWPLLREQWASRGNSMETCMVLDTLNHNNTLAIQRVNDCHKGEEKKTNFCVCISFDLYFQAWVVYIWCFVCVWIIMASCLSSTNCYFHRRLQDSANMLGYLFPQEAWWKTISKPIFLKRLCYPNTTALVPMVNTQFAVLLPKGEELSHR